jgi:hypothetical protein
MNPLPLSDNLSQPAYLSPFWKRRLLRGVFMVKNDETSSVPLRKKTAYRLVSSFFRLKNPFFDTFLHICGNDF